MLPLGSFAWSSQHSRTRRSIASPSVGSPVVDESLIVQDDIFDYEHALINTSGTLKDPWNGHHCQGLLCEISAQVDQRFVNKYIESCWSIRMGSPTPPGQPSTRRSSASRRPRAWASNQVFVYQGSDKPPTQTMESDLRPRAQSSPMTAALTASPSPTLPLFGVAVTSSAWM